MEKLLYKNRPRLCGSREEKADFNTSLRCLVLSLFIFSITIFSSGCGSEFKVLLDAPPQAPEAVIGLSLDKTSSITTVGGTIQLFPRIIPSGAINRDVTWSSDAPGIAEVNSNGLVSGISVGNTTITAITADGNYPATCAVTVSSTSEAVTGVNLDKTVSGITVGGTIQLNHTISPADATNQNVIWSSDATGVAAVSSSGLVSGVSAGTATVTVTTVDGNYTAICVVTVSTATVSVTGVNLDKTTSAITVGGTVQLNPTVSPSNATNQNVTWSSNSTGVATVSSSGLVSGVAAGTATITVTTEDGNYPATCVVTVSPVTIPVAEVNLDKTSSSITVGGTVQLNPTVSPSDATNQNVTWSSNSTGVATVSSSGLVSGVAAGTATITVTTVDGNYPATCVVTVSPVTIPVAGVSLDKTTSSITVGGTVQLNPTVSPSNATNQNVTWSSNSTGVATVSSSGLVSGVAVGTATITVKTVDGNYPATCVVTVSTASVPVTGVSLNLAASTKYIGETVQLTPTIIPSNATNQNVTWTSNSTGVATVSSSGLVTGVALGTATVTVKTVDGNFPASCAVTVANAIFWTETDKTINKIYTNNSGEAILLTVSGTPLDIALDTSASGKKMYWAEYSGSSYQIKRAGFDGTGSSNFSSAYSSSTYFGPTAIAIDKTNSKIYWNQFQSSNAVLYSSLTTFVEHTVRNGISPNYTHSLCIDAIHNNFYMTTDSYWNLGFTTGSGNSGSACYGGTSGSTYNIPINLTGASSPSMAARGIAVDANGSYVYYVDNSGTYPRIMKSTDLTMNPSTPTVWITNSGGSYGGIQKIALDLNNRKIYWISDTNNRIYRADLDTANSNIELFLQLGSKPTGIAVTQ
jgi:uncharacterized protein YjdB